eukprot:sb/3463616/
MILEICVDSVESAVEAERGGAHRLELCASLELGGLTPTIGLLVSVKKAVNLPVFCMVRPRSGDFVYTTCEVDIMATDMEYLIAGGADGFVFGCLNADLTIDEHACKRLISICKDQLPVTFHRAFDLVWDIEKSLKLLNTLGVRRILTTGGGSSVDRAALCNLKKITDVHGGSITILPGGGIKMRDKGYIFFPCPGGCRFRIRKRHFGILTNRKMILEICVDSVESAVEAERGGAHRLELCASLELGGLTPTIGLLVSVKKAVNLPVFCMVRPRSGDFVYTTCEVDIMATDMEYLIAGGADGFVFGCLNDDLTIDEHACKRLISICKDQLPVTFHRAFDLVRDIEKSLKLLNTLGVRRILTTGGGSSVDRAALCNLKKITDVHGGSITILPGGGVNPTNVGYWKEMGFLEVHASCSEFIGEQEYGVTFNSPLPRGKRKQTTTRKSLLRLSHDECTRRIPRRALTIMFQLCQMTTVGCYSTTDLVVFKLNSHVSIEQCREPRLQLCCHLSFNCPVFTCQANSLTSVLAGRAMNLIPETHTRLNNQSKLVI